MQKHILRYLSLCTLGGSVLLHAAGDVNPTFMIRSQGLNSVRRLVGQSGIYTALCGMRNDNCHSAYGTASITPEYTRSFRNHNIITNLFGDAAGDTNNILIQGSQVPGRDARALLADYFYLPTDFESTVCFSPRIQNILVDLNYYIGLDNWWEGLYFAAQAPLTRTKWSLGMSELVSNPGTNGYAAGYFSPNAINRNTLLMDFTTYAAGNSPGSLPQSVGIGAPPIFETTTVQLQPLQFAKIQGHKAYTTISEIRYYLGWNFLLSNDYHVGINLQTSAPTGNRPHAEYLFYPQNGNGKHTEFGIGFGGHYTAWRSEDEESSWGVEWNLDVTHLFKTHQCRTFDLNDKPLSRYMLAEQLSSDIVDSLQGPLGNAPTAQITGVFTPVANLTTVDVNVSVGAQIDFLAMIRYQSGNFSYEFGYNLWTRTCEHIDFDCNPCDTFPANRWALKGDAQVYGFDVLGTTSPLLIGFVPLSATENNATINGGTNFGIGGVSDSTAITTAQENPNIDNPELAFGQPSITVNSLSISPTGVTAQINTSIEPIFIQQSDINFARNKGLTHKIFAYGQYMWDCEDTWIPYFGWGIEVEFAQLHRSCETNSNEIHCEDTCNKETKGSCIRSGVSQWGIFAKIGLSYQ